MVADISPRTPINIHRKYLFYKGPARNIPRFFRSYHRRAFPIGPGRPRSGTSAAARRSIANLHRRTARSSRDNGAARQKTWTCPPPGCRGRREPPAKKRSAQHPAALQSAAPIITPDRAGTIPQRRVCRYCRTSFAANAPSCSGAGRRVFSAATRNPGTAVSAAFSSRSILHEAAISTPPGATSRAACRMMSC